MSDPLLLLRSFICDKKQITVHGDYICFDDLAFHKTAPTNYIMFKGKGGDHIEKNDYYTLETLYFFSRHYDLKYTAYLQKTTSEGVPAIRFPDRKDLLHLFADMNATSSNIDKTVAIPQSYPTQSIVQDLYGKSIRKRDKITNDIKNFSNLNDEQSYSTDNINNYTQNFSSIKPDSIPLNDADVDFIDENGIIVSMLHNFSATNEHDSGTGYTKKITKKEIDDLFIATLSNMIKNEKKFIINEQNKKYINYMIDKPYRVSRLREKIDKNNNHYESYDRMATKNDIIFAESSIKNFSEILNYLEPRKNKTIETPIQDNTYHSRNRTNVQPMGKIRSYSRYDQEKFREEEDTAGFKINVLGSFQGLKKSSAIPTLNTSSNLWQEHNNDHASYVPPDIDNINSKLLANDPTSAKIVDRLNVSNRHESRIPIIIVPMVSNTLININNIKTFLEDYTYTTVDTIVNKNNAKLNNQEEILIQRKKTITIDGKIQTTTVPYRCISNVSKLKPSDWDKVVAVFVHGPTWQFKGWPWLGFNNDPNDIFTHVQGFHVFFQNESIDPNVKKWNIELLTISKAKRYLDKACVTKFWQILDKFVTVHKKNLRI